MLSDPTYKNLKPSRAADSPCKFEFDFDICVPTNVLHPRSKLEQARFYTHTRSQSSLHILVTFPLVSVSQPLLHSVLVSVS